MERGQEHHARVGHDAEFLVDRLQRVHPIAPAGAQPGWLGEEPLVVNEKGAAVGEEFDAGDCDERVALEAAAGVALVTERALAAGVLLGEFDDLDGGVKDVESP